MEEYIDVLGAILMTAIVVAVVGIIILGGYVIYKYIKDEY
jgi:hypothetical protein